MTAEPIATEQRRGGDPAPVLAKTPIRFPAGVVPSPDPIPEGMTPEDLADLRRQQAANQGKWYLKHLPAIYRDAALCDLDFQQDPDGAIARWLDSDRPTLMLVGSVGTGKTHAGYAVTNEAVSRGVLTVAVQVPDLLASMRPGGDSTVAARARTAELLLLDDLGTEKPSEWTAEQLTALLDARVREGRRTIVTTNSDYATLAARLGERTMSRLTGGAVVVKLTGDDRRRRTW